MQYYSVIQMFLKIGKFNGPFFFFLSVMIAILLKRDKVFKKHLGASRMHCELSTNGFPCQLMSLSLLKSLVIQLCVS